MVEHVAKGFAELIPGLAHSNFSLTLPLDSANATSAGTNAYVLAGVSISVKYSTWFWLSPMEATGSDYKFAARRNSP